MFNLKDHENNLVNIGAMGTVVLDVELVFTLAALATAIALNLVKTYYFIKDRRNSNGE